MKTCSDCGREIPDLMFWLYTGSDDRPLCKGCYTKDIQKTVLEQGKITTVDQMSLDGEYFRKQFDKKSLQEMLDKGQIYEFKKGWFKKI